MNLNMQLKSLWKISKKLLYKNSEFWANMKRNTWERWSNNKPKNASDKN